MIYISIDPGAKGAIVVTNGEKMIRKEMMPLKKDRTIDSGRLFDMFRQELDAMSMVSDIKICIEEVHSLYGMSAKSNFNFGRNFQAPISVLDSLECEWEFVKAKEWQKEVFGDMEIILNKKGKKDTKAMSIKRAMELYPEADLTPTERAKKPSDGIADALCMCEFIKRKYGHLDL